MIGAILPYYGSKRRLASTIVREAGPHHSWFEPFAGSMAVILAKPRCKIETLNDLNGDVVNLACVIASGRWAELHDRAARTLYCETIFDSALEALADPCEPAASAEAVTQEHVTRAYHFLVASWQGLHGLVGCADGRSEYFGVRFKGRGIAAQAWVSVADSLPHWHQRLRGVTITRRCGFKMLAKIPDEPGVVVYCDPPYIVKQDAYQHDFADGDHQRLAEALARFTQARVIVSYYDHPALADLYPGWQVWQLPTVKSIANSSRGSAKQTAPEVLLVNRPGVAVAMPFRAGRSAQRQRLLWAG